MKCHSDAMIDHIKLPSGFSSSLNVSSVTCDGIHIPSDGVIKSGQCSGKVKQYGVCTMGCNSGFHLSTNASRECLSSGWSGKVIKCTKGL